jgi:hypothetical protein
MSPYDSESDRRDAVRKRLVDNCLRLIYDTIRIGSVTNTQEERRYLETAIAHKLLDGLRLESMSMMMRQEIHTAEAEIEKT